MRNRLFKIFAAAVLAVGTVFAALGTSSPNVAEAASKTGSAERFYYDQLSDNEKLAYDKLAWAMQRGDFKIDISNLMLDADSMTRVQRAIANELEPDVYPYGSENYDWYTMTYYQASGLAANLVINYDARSSEYVGAQERFDKAAAEVLAQAKKKRSDYAKLKFIHDWLVNNTDYLAHSDSNYEPMYADGPIVRGRADCGGYAKAFKYLAQSLGIDCIMVIGSTEGAETVNHAWNMVKLNGVWYNVDVTWDDRSVSGDNKIYYRYFLKGDRNFGVTHVPVEGYTYPEAPRDYSSSSVGTVVLAIVVLCAAAAAYLLWKRIKQKRAALRELNGTSDWTGE